MDCCRCACAAIAGVCAAQLRCACRMRKYGYVLGYMIHTSMIRKYDRGNATLLSYYSGGEQPPTSRYTYDTRVAPPAVFSSMWSTSTWKNRRARVQYTMGCCCSGGRSRHRRRRYTTLSADCACVGGFQPPTNRLPPPPVDTPCPLLGDHRMVRTTRTKLTATVCDNVETRYSDVFVGTFCFFEQASVFQCRVTRTRV